MYALLLSILFAGQTDTPEFVAVSPADDCPSGALVRLSQEFTATLRTKNGETTVADVISLRRAGRVVPSFPTGAHLVTTFGDRIVGTLVGGDSQSVQFRPSGVEIEVKRSWRVPLSAAGVVWLSDTPSNTPLDVSRYRWLADLTNQDALRFRNGDLMRGTIEGFDPEADSPRFTFRPARGESHAIAARELSAIAFNPALARARKPKGPYARVVLADGSRLAVTNVAVADGRLTGSALFGQKVQVPLTAIVALDIVAAKGVSLSDLKPKKVEQNGFLGVTWSWAPDRTVRGEAIRVSTAEGIYTADKGLGTHPRTILTYDLGGKYRRFEALVGLDPETHVKGNVAIRIVVDGKERMIPGLNALADGKVVPVRINITGAKELILAIDFGSAGGIGCDVNWADARLVE